MSETFSDLASWLAIAGLGLFHGLNPAMGWLFAVALGLHRHSQRVVLVSLMPIALGHATAVAAVFAGALALGWALDWTILARLTGAALIAWAIWHALYGHRQRVRVGMQTGMAGLVLWSFLVANAHGAGLMLVPVAMPLCLASGPAPELTAGDPWQVAAAALAVHTAAMLATIGAISLLVYNWVGVDFLRRRWINLDLVWIGALCVCGLALLIA